MRFTLNLGMGGSEHYLAVAQAAEAAGYASIALSDSLFFPKHTDSTYPYANTEQVRDAIAATAFIEPFVGMSCIAAVTRRIRFYPSVLKVPVRQPLLLAKSLSSLAAMSNDRVTLGAGISPWREDFSYNGLDFDKRGKLMDECIAILRGALTGEFFEFHGENYDFGPMKMSPVPKKPIPILIGGHARPALVRAARLGDGWLAANTDFETFKGLLNQLNALRKEYGTDKRADFEIHGFDVNAKTVADFKRMEDIGATDCLVTPWNMYAADLDLQAKIDGINRLADQVVSKM